MTSSITPASGSLLSGDDADRVNSKIVVRNIRDLEREEKKKPKVTTSSRTTTLTMGRGKNVPKARSQL
jgi:hypothetical protein